MTRQRARTAALSVLLLTSGLMLSVSPANAAPADDTLTIVTITMRQPATVSVEYGQYWEFNYVQDHENMIIGGAGERGVHVDGAPSGYQANGEYYCRPSGYCGSTYEGWISPSLVDPPLEVGTYAITVVIDTVTEAGRTWHADNPAPGRLTVTPAKLAVVTSVHADSSNRDAIVVTADLTGQFVDTFFQGSGPVAATLEGTWQISIADSAGEVVAERSLDGVTGDGVLATSLYWPGAEPETAYVATASFTPSSADRAEFSVTQGTPVKYSTPSAQRSLPAEDATSAPSAAPTSRPAPMSTPIPASELADAELASAYTVSLPPWAVVLTIVMLAALGILVGMLGRRLHRTRTPALTAPSAIADTDE